MTQHLSTIPPPPPSVSSLTIDGWIHLSRPVELSPEDFERALDDLTRAHKLAWRVIGNQVYVKWTSAEKES